ncbi:hypothetical protein [uncultured Dubosiella sp.]|uniref:hypothetical protein n=1 Tax=uncultured Dubosiella sp. TaxID=1937011 RepID=UPI0027298C85|nr:hypothetical protein [uncultured Dubosiella sp.]
MYTIKKLGDGKESGSGEKGTRCQERKRKKFFESDYQARSQEIKKSIYFIRFLDIGPGTYESIVTNLDKDEFTITEIKELYHRRWEIETLKLEYK